MGLVSLTPGLNVIQGSDLFQVVGSIITDSGIKSIPDVHDVAYGTKAISGIWLLMFLDSDDASALAIPGGESPDKLHLTVGALDPSTCVDKQDIINQILEQASTSLPPVKGKIGGIGQFMTDSDKVPVVALFDSVDLNTWRDELLGTLKVIGIELLSDHGYTPHVTLAYVDKPIEVDLTEVVDREIELGVLSLVWEGDQRDFQLTGTDVKGGPGSGHWGHAGIPGKRGGSAPGGVSLGIYKKARRSLRLAVNEVQSHGLSTGNEAAVGLRYGGEKVDGTLTGTEDAVYFDKHEDVMKQSKIVVHNHPSSGSFSDADTSILFSDNWGADHMVVVGNDGTMYRLSRTIYTKARQEIIQMAPAVASGDRETGHVRVIQYLWNREKSILMSKYRPRVMSGEISEDAAWKEHSHEMMLTLSKQLGLDYQRILP